MSCFLTLNSVFNKSIRLEQSYVFSQWTGGNMTIQLEKFDANNYKGYKW